MKTGSLFFPPLPFLPSHRRASLCPGTGLNCCPPVLQTGALPTELPELTPFSPSESPERPWVRRSSSVRGKPCKEGNLPSQLPPDLSVNDSWTPSPHSLVCTHTFSRISETNLHSFSRQVRGETRGSTDTDRYPSRPEIAFCPRKALRTRQPPLMRSY